MHRHVNVVFYFDFKIIYREQFRVQRCLLICDPMFIIIALIFPPTLKNVTKLFQQISYMLQAQFTPYPSWKKVNRMLAIQSKYLRTFRCDIRKHLYLKKKTRFIYIEALPLLSTKFPHSPAAANTPSPCFKMIFTAYIGNPVSTG